MHTDTQIYCEQKKMYLVKKICAAAAAAAAKENNHYNKIKRNVNRTTDLKTQ